jgi:predicted phage baseplate assembly protein
MLNDPVTAIPQLTLADSFSVWTCRPSLLASERFDRHVVVETEHDGTVSLRFGDNIMGLAPDPQDSFTVSGRFGMPLDGNIGADVLGHAVTKVPGIESLSNPLPAQGGVAPLSPTQIRIEAPQAFRTQQRAVTEADWAEMAERQPEVAKAVARIRWTGAWRTAFVYVDRKGGLPVESDADFCTRMLDHLELYRLAGVDLALRGPLQVALDIMLRLCVQPGVLRSAVWQAVLERLGTGILPDARRGLFHPDNFTFGAPLYLSTLVAAVMEVPGVASVEPLRFQRWAKAAVNELAQGVIHAGETEVLRLDNDPNYPENGRLAIELLGGA